MVLNLLFFPKIAYCISIHYFSENLDYYLGCKFVVARNIIISHYDPESGHE